MNVNNLQASPVGREIAAFPENPADYRLICVTAGQLNILHDGQSNHAVSGQVVITTLSGGNLTACPGEDFAGYMLQIHNQVAAELVRRYLLYMKVADSSVVVLNGGKHAQSIQLLMENIGEELQNGTPSAAIVELRLQELLVRLQQTNPVVSAEAYSNRADIVSSVHALLKKRFYTTLSLEAIATEYNISVSYLAHIFKEITGMSVMRCLLLIRIREAQKYLEQTNMPINEIVEKSGFNNISNFGRTFKKETGLSPRQYRQLHSQKDRG